MISCSYDSRSVSFKEEISSTSSTVIKTILIVGMVLLTLYMAGLFISRMQYAGFTKAFFKSDWILYSSTMLSSGIILTTVTLPKINPPLPNISEATHTPVPPPKKTDSPTPLPLPKPFPSPFDDRILLMPTPAIISAWRQLQMGKSYHFTHKPPSKTAFPSPSPFPKPLSHPSEDRLILSSTPKKNGDWIKIQMGKTSLLIDLNKVDWQDFLHLLDPIQLPSEHALIPVQKTPQKIIDALIQKTLLGDFVEIPKASLNDIPKGNLLDYVTRVCPKYKDTFIELTNKGHELIQAFQNSVPGDVFSPERTIFINQRRALAAPFVWYLMSLAQTEQGKGFREGMIVLQDENYRIHNFFAPAASKRASTHYKMARLTSFGMDIYQDNASGLPGNHQTMHFGKLATLDTSKHYTFVKPESWGTESITQIVGHGISWAFSRIPHLLGWGQSADEYKEHPPPKLIKSYKTLLKSIAPLENPSSKWGVGGMVIFLRDFLKAKEHALYKKKIWEFVKENNLRNYPAVCQGSEVVVILGKQNRSEPQRLNKPFIELLDLLKPYSDEL